MMNNNIDKILDEFKINVAIYNFEKEYEDEINQKTIGYALKNKEIWRKYTMKKRIIATVCTGIVLISGIAVATNIESIKDYFRGLGGGIDSAIEHGYIANPEMDYIESNANISEETGKILDNISVEAKIEDFLMDDLNLSTEFCFKFDEKIKDFVNLDNLNNIELNDLIVRDEDNRIIYSGNDKEAFEKYCQENNLNYVFGECNENYLNCGLNWFPSYHNKENNLVKLTYNIYSDGFPKSKKLYFSFSKITLTEENKDRNSNKVILQGDWKINVDVPENMYNRTTECYKVVNCDNENFEVYSSSISDTGFEIGVIISNIEKPVRTLTVNELK